MLEILFLYVATICLIWRFGFAPLLVRRTQNELLDIASDIYINHSKSKDKQKALNYVQSLAEYAKEVSWQRSLYIIIFLKVKGIKIPFNTTPNIFDDDEINKVLEKAVFSFSRLVIAKSPLLIILTSLVSVLIVLGVFVFDKMKNKLNGLVAINLELSKINH